MDSSSYFGSSSMMSPASELDDPNPFASNPFADMHSSAYHQPQAPAPLSPPPQTSSPPAHTAPYSPPAREPEPQSPFGAEGGFASSYTAPVAEEEQTPFYVPPSPRLPSSLYAQHDVPSAFGSPTASGGFGDVLSASASTSPYPTQHTRQGTSPADLADLLGEEQPILPSFKKKMAAEPTFRRDMMEQMAMEDKSAKLAAAAAARDGAKGADGKVLPESSLGSKKVGGHLAALLGLEPDEKELKREAELKQREAEKRKRIEEKQAKLKEDQERERKLQEEEVTASEAAKTEPAVAEDDETPISTPAATTPTLTDTPAQPPVPSALATPLPPSPTASPAPPDPAEPGPALSRTSSLAPSVAASDAASDSAASGAYDAVVSPMGSNGAEHTGPDPFASFYQQPDEPRRAAGVSVQDTDEDSLRGTYSRSLSVAGSEETETERTHQERALPTSPPLPPLPNLGETAGSPPRSAELGGSLGPSFIISVGDPQKVGNALNVAAQHTVYTVHTRTSHPAFRKKDFSVLRRFSHFLWLFDALTNNNPGVIVPGMPEKSAIGRFGSEFVENRRQGLETALMKIVAHPMLVGDPDLRLFLESDTFAVEIKQRKIEQPSEGKGFLGAFGLPFASGPTFVEFDDYFDTRRNALETFEAQLRALLATLHTATAARTGVQNGLADLETALANLAHCEVSDALRGALEGAAVLHKRLRLLQEQQTKSEEGLGGLTTVAESYARLCVSAKLVFGARIKAFHSWQAAEEKLRKARAAHDKAKRAGRDMLGLSISEISEDGSLRLVFGHQAERRQLDAKSDFEDVSKLTKAEMARFDKEKVDDFKRAVEHYADGLQSRQREIVQLWQHYYDTLLRFSAANQPHQHPGAVQQQHQPAPEQAEASA